MDHNDGLVERHDRRFVALEVRATNLEKDMERVMDITERLDEDYFNHGRDGLKTQFLALVNQTIGAEKEQVKRHQENATKLNLIVALCAVATLVVLAVSVIVTVELSRRSDMDPAKIFHSSAPIQAYSIGTDAKIPALGR